MVFFSFKVILVMLIGFLFIRRSGYLFFVCVRVRVRVNLGSISIGLVFRIEGLFWF